ncbi:hypothetical protein GTP81_09840 [Rugamonas sp. FT107W]|uniref:Uncharacterized protein n=1 Tax=Duganella vulcania TaxID=2692166 RepID=A0A845HCX3_9BURK|nr:hypothetical protein [Duganella vulcania]MYN17052.1 hypothetical protein [Duganella vulcania]
MHNEKPMPHERDFSWEVNQAAMRELERYAEGIAEHFVSHESLAAIARSKVHPDYAEANYLQQAGKAAEVKQVARENVERMLKGDKSRVVRTDDVGYSNHQEFDLVGLDQVSAGDAPVTGAQMKVFKDVGSYRKLFNQEFDHYQRAELLIPPDQFEAVMADWAKQRQAALEQRDQLALLGKTDEARKLQQRIDRIDHARDRAKPSTVSTTDAMEARKSPGLSVAKDALDVAHRAGMEAAQTGAAIGGGLSLIRNVVAVSKNGKDVGAAVQEIFQDTGKAAAGAYASGALSAGIGGALRNANHQLLQNLGRSNAPAMAVQVSAMIGKSVVELAAGRISSDEFVRSVSKDGSLLAVSMTGSNLGAVVGTVVFPGVGTVVGGLVGGMAASMLGGHLQAHLLNAAAELDASNALRAKVKAATAHVVRRHEAYRREMDEAFNVFFAEKSEELKRGFALISAASPEDGRLREGLALIASAMNKKLAFANEVEFAQHLRSGETLVF